MLQEVTKHDGKHCFACVQWDGQRTIDPKTKAVKVDKTKEENCRLHHKTMKGSGTCEHFFPLA